MDLKVYSERLRRWNRTRLHRSGVHQQAVYSFEDALEESFDLWVDSDVENEENPNSIVDDILP